MKEALEKKGRQVGGGGLYFPEREEKIYHLMVFLIQV